MKQYINKVQNLQTIPQHNLHSYSNTNSSAAHLIEASPHLISHSANQLSTSQNTTFALQTIIAISLVLKICGIGKFTNFTLPPAPIKFEHPVPNSSFNISQYEEMLCQSPEAQVIANYVKEEIKKSSVTEWTEADIRKFINSPQFEEYRKLAEDVKKILIELLNKTLVYLQKSQSELLLE